MRAVLRKLLFMCLMAVLLILCAFPAAAYTSYDTYTYNYDGSAQKTPDAYVPRKFPMNAAISTLGLSEPSQIVTDEQENVYIADKGNNRIVILDANFESIRVVESFVNAAGEQEYFSNPEGVFVDVQQQMYICDTNNNRVVILDAAGKLKSILCRPESNMLSADFEFLPTSAAADRSGRVYVIARNCNLGVMSFSADGEFETFLGAQKVNPSIGDIIWRYFMTEEQKKRSEQFVPTQYNYVTVDSDGFLFVTSDSIDPYDQYNAITSRDTSDKFAPVKRLNSSGEDVLSRNGFFPPAGDIEIGYENAQDFSPSAFVAVATTKNGQYSVLDANRCKIFTYSADGDLLYVFGMTGNQLGTFSQASGLCYKGTSILVLDSQANTVTVFDRTSYGDRLNEALVLYEQRRYKESTEAWSSLLDVHANMDIARSGMAAALYRSGAYEEAMQCYKAVSNWKGYSQAFGMYRKEIVRRYLWLVLLVVALCGVLIWGGVRAVKRVIQRPVPQTRLGRLGYDLCYAFRFIFHPFQCSWEISREGKGSMSAAGILLGFSVFTMIVRRAVTGYIFAGENAFSDAGLWMDLITVLLPFGLWCVSNWCITTLMDGEGSLRIIAVVTSYSLTPLILLQIPLAVISNFMLQTEAIFYTLISGISIVWTALLLFVAVLTVHDYSLGKNVATVFMTVIAMLFICFLGLLFVNLIQRLISFAIELYQEVAFRL